MKTERRLQIFSFNRQRAKNAEMAADMEILLHALPSGQVKQLLKHKVCAAILEKYGISGS